MIILDDSLAGQLRRAHRMDRMQGERTHWTNMGVFRLEPAVLCGSWLVRLYVGTRLIGTFDSPWTATRQIRAGELDAEIGFAASTLGIPRDYEDWNSLR